MLVVKAAVARAPKIENEIDRFVFIMGAILHDCGKPASGRKNGLSKNGFTAVKDHAEAL